MATVDETIFWVAHAASVLPVADIADVVWGSEPHIRVQNMSEEVRDRVVDRIKAHRRIQAKCFVYRPPHLPYDLVFDNVLCETHRGVL